MKPKIVVALLALSLAGIGIALLSHPADQATAKDACCPAGDMTLPAELIKKFPPGELHSPYPDTPSWRRRRSS